MNWNEWREAVETSAREQLGVDLGDIQVPKKEMKDCWQQGMLPEDFVGERLATHQEREEIDLRLEL